MEELISALNYPRFALIHQSERIYYFCSTDEYIVDMILTAGKHMSYANGLELTAYWEKMHLGILFSFSSIYLQKNDFSTHTNLLQGKPIMLTSVTFEILADLLLYILCLLAWSVVGLHCQFLNQSPSKCPKPFGGWFHKTYSALLSSLLMVWFFSFQELHYTACSRR